MSADGLVLTVVGGHVTETALLAAGELEADAETNTFTRSDVGGSFLTDGFVTGMTFTAAGMASNGKTYVIKTVTADVITVEGDPGELVDEVSAVAVQLLSVGNVSELANETAAVGVQLVGVGQRGPALDTVLKLRAAVFEKAVEKGARGDPNELGVLASQLIDNLVNGEPITAALKADVIRAYLYNWVDEIDEAVRHWAEFGLAFTKAMFDPDSRRELQQKVGAETGFADSADPNTIRSRAEDGVGFLDVLIEELDDPNGDGSTFDSFINKHLLPMLGLPAELGLLRSGVQSVTSQLRSSSSAIRRPVQPARGGGRQGQNHRQGFPQEADRRQIRRRLRGFRTAHASGQQDGPRVHHHRWQHCPDLQARRPREARPSAGPSRRSP